jgi:hypothetical protein
VTAGFLIGKRVLGSMRQEPFDWLLVIMAIGGGLKLVIR